MFIVMLVCRMRKYRKNVLLSCLGAGRAFGIICAYYHFVLKIPLSKIPYDLAPIRSCGYFDRVFLENAAIIYKKAYE